MALLGYAYFMTGVMQKSLQGLILGILFLIAGAGQTIYLIRYITVAIVLLRNRKEWKRKAKKDHLEILDRKAEYNEYAEFREQMWECEWQVKLPARLADLYGKKIFNIPVSTRIYDKMRDQKIVNIYYSTEDPYSILIGG